MNELNPITLPQFHSAPPDPPLVMPSIKQHNTLSCDWGAVPFYSYELPKEPREALAAALRAAPHLSACADYAETAPDKPLRLILCAEHFPTAVQAAACLSACHSVPDTAVEEGAAWSDLWEELDRELGSNESVPPLSAALLLSDAALLDPSAAETESPLQMQAILQKRAALLDVRQQADALLLHAKDTLPAQEVLEYLASAQQRSIFLVMSRKQFDRTLLNRLCFEQGFRVCRLGIPSRGYQERVFRAVAVQEQLRLAPEIDLSAVITRLKRQRGALYSDADFAPLLRRSAEEYGRRRPLTTEQLFLRDEAAADGTALQKLEGLVGLRTVKDAVRGIVAETLLDGKRAEAGLPTPPRCRNLVFSGEPGTCKSVTARLLAQALQESGASSGAFIEAGREQLIGRYMGATSPMVSKLFERARGGVLFIDEAGALISHGGNDFYSEEAVNALVRHMELCPETTVIFATYPEEADTLLGQNPGLSSRIARVIQFPPYTDDELCNILAYLAQEGGYRLPEGWRTIAADFAHSLRAQQRDRFGNGREMRRLLTETIGALALRVADGEERLDLLHPEDLAAASRTLLGEVRRAETRIGF